MDYNIFRWYRSSFGRYTQGDPIGLEGGYNVYAYGADDPLLNIDPSGLNSVKACGSKWIGIFGKLDAVSSRFNKTNNIIGFCASCPNGQTPMIAGAHLDPTPPVNGKFNSNPDVSLLMPGDASGADGVDSVASECGGCSGPNEHLFIANVRTSLSLTPSALEDQKKKYSLVFECHGCKKK